MVLTGYRYKSQYRQETDEKSLYSDLGFKVVMQVP